MLTVFRKIEIYQIKQLVAVCMGELHPPLQTSTKCDGLGQILLN